MLTKKLLSAFLSLLMITTAVIIAPTNNFVLAEETTATSFASQHAYIDFQDYTLFPQSSTNNTEHRYRAATLKTSPWDTPTEEGTENKYLKYEFSWPEYKSDNYDGEPLGPNHTSTVAIRKEGATHKSNAAGTQTLLDYSGDNTQHIVLEENVKYRISFRYKMSDSSDTSGLRFRIDASQGSGNTGVKHTKGVKMLEATDGVISNGANITETGDEWKDFYMVVQPTATDLYSNVDTDTGKNYLRLRWGVPSLKDKTDTDNINFKLCIDDLQVDTIDTAEVKIYKDGADTTQIHNITYAPACDYNENLFSVKEDFTGGILNKETGKFESIAKSLDALNMSGYGISIKERFNGIYHTSEAAEPLASIPATTGATYYAKYTTIQDENAFTPRHVDVDFTDYTIDNSENMVLNNLNLKYDETTDSVLATNSTTDGYTTTGNKIPSFYKKSETTDDGTTNYFLKFNTTATVDKDTEGNLTVNADGDGKYKFTQYYTGRQHRCSFYINAEGPFKNDSSEFELVPDAYYRVKFRYRNKGENTLTAQFETGTVHPSTGANTSGNGTIAKIYEENGEELASSKNVTSSLDATEWQEHSVIIKPTASGYLRMRFAPSPWVAYEIDIDDIQVDRIDDATVISIHDGEQIGENEPITYAPACEYNSHLFSNEGNFEGGILNTVTGEYEDVDTVFAPTTDIPEGAKLEGLFNAPVGGQQVVYMPASKEKTYYARYKTALFAEKFNYGLEGYMLNSDANVTVETETENNILKLAQTSNGDSKLYKKLTGLKSGRVYILSFRLKLTVNTGTDDVGYAGISTAEPTNFSEADNFTVNVPEICSYYTDNENATYSLDPITKKGIIRYSNTSNWATYSVKFFSKSSEAYFYIENSGNNQNIYLDNIELLETEEADDYALSDINVPVATMDTVNVLMIGNSFTADATRELDDVGGIIDAGDKDLRVARLMVGSTNVAFHTEQIENNKDGYQFRYYTKETGIQSRTSASFKSAVNMLHANSQKWDYIVVQAATTTEWEGFATANSDRNQGLEHLVELLKSQDNCDKSNVVIYCTWSHEGTYAQSTSYKSQEAMHEKVIQSVNNIKAATGCDVINMEEIFYDIRNDDELKIGDNLNRDGYHLSNIGATAVGLAIYEFFTDTAVTESSWTKASFSQYISGLDPKPFTATQIEGVKKIVHKYISCNPVDDNEVNSDDLEAVRSEILKGTTAITANINCDGKTDIRDLVHIKKLIQ